MKKLSIPYNSQRDNPVAAGVRGSSQCGYTAVAMMLSPFIPESARDQFIADLVRKMETPGSFRDRILAVVTRAKGQRAGMYGDAYAEAVTQLIAEYKLPLRAVWISTGGTVAQLEATINSGFAAVLSTMITSSGHYITVVGYDKDNWICHDPYGDGFTGYANTNGAYVKYPRAWLEATARKSDPKKTGLRFLTLRKI